MEPLCLTPEEARELITILDDRLLELKAEIHHTGSYEYKTQLEHEKESLRQLLHKLEKYEADQLLSS